MLLLIKVILAFFSNITTSTFKMHKYIHFSFAFLYGLSLSVTAQCTQRPSSLEKKGTRAYSEFESKDRISLYGKYVQEKLLYE